jgi:hypothetical protein
MFIQISKKGKSHDDHLILAGVRMLQIKRMNPENSLNYPFIRLSDPFKNLSGYPSDSRSSG